MARRATVRDMHSEVESRHQCRPGKDRGQRVTILQVFVHLQTPVGRNEHMLLPVSD